MKYYKLIYYTSKGCKSCKGYDNVVDKVSHELRIDSTYIDIDEGVIRHSIEGVPCLIIEDEKSSVLYKNVGNLSYDMLIKDIKEKLKDD